MKLLRQYAIEKGLKVVREFQEAESAKGAGRKVFNEMLAYLKANSQVRCLLCEKTDRLSRNFKDIATLDQLMNEQGLTILLVKENTELSKDSKSHEKFMFGIKALMAKNYVDNLSEEVKKGMREKAPQCPSYGNPKREETTKQAKPWNIGYITMLHGTAPTHLAPQMMETG